MTIPELREIYALLLMGAQNSRHLDNFEQAQRFSDVAQKVSNELDRLESRS